MTLPLLARREAPILARVDESPSRIVTLPPARAWDRSPQGEPGAAPSSRRGPGSGLRASTHPVARYLARLGPSTRPTVVSALHVAARILLARPDATCWDVPWTALDPLVLATLRDRLAAHYSSPASARRSVIYVRQVLGEAFHAGQLPADAWMRAQRLKGPPGSAPATGRALTDPEIGRLLAGPLADAAGSSRRDAALLAVLFSTGIRRAECVGLDLVDYQEGRLDIRHAKGGRQRHVILPTWARPVLDAWIVAHPHPTLGALWLAGPSPGPLRAERLPWAAVAGILATWAHRAGLGRLLPHDARRTVATRMLRAGVDALLVRHHLGHAHVATTQRYDLRTSDDCAAALERLPCPWTPAGIPPEGA